MRAVKRAKTKMHDADAEPARVNHGAHRFRQQAGRREAEALPR
jgi:hypothetical protein